MACSVAAEAVEASNGEHGMTADGLRAEAERLLDLALSRFEEGSVLHMTGKETELPARPVSYDDAPTPSGAATLAEAHARLRPAEYQELSRLLVPATGIVTRAPYMAGTWLRVMSTVATP
jgi:hypothetical protein